MREIFAGLLLSTLVGAQPAGFTYPPQMEGARTVVYKRVGDVELKLYIFDPPAPASTQPRAAIIFFFGGGWTGGSPKQFEPQCRYLAGRGMLAISADYRVASRHQVKVPDCVRDAKSAVRWLRKNAARLGVDPRRIAAGGGSAGGHLAAAAALLDDFDEPGEDTSVSARPDALVLFNPALVLAPVEGVPTRGGVEQLRERLGGDPLAVSPYHHIRKGAPPTIIFHGKADTTVPYATIELFARKMQELGNRCELVGFEGATHGFFNYGRGNNQAYQETLRKTDEFLVSLGYLKPPAASR